MKSQTLTPLSSLPVPPPPDADPEFSITSSGSTKRSKSFDAFSFLMSRNNENEAWKEAAEAEKSKWGKIKEKGKGKGSMTDKASSNGTRSANAIDDEEIEDASEGGRDVKMEKGGENEPGKSGPARRAAPFYKVMQGMPIAVDAFRYGKIPGVTAYLLT